MSTRGFCLSYVLYVLLSIRIAFLPSDMSCALYCHVHRWIVHLCMCPTFYFDMTIWNAFIHPICHMLYIVMSTCDVFFHAMCPAFYFISVQSEHVHPSGVSYALLLSFPTVMCSFIPCKMFSDFSVYPWMWRFLSTRRKNYRIRNCLNSAVVLRYASSQTL